MLLKNKLFQGVCFYLGLQKLCPVAMVQQVTFVMRVFGTMDKDAWIWQLEGLGLTCGGRLGKTPWRQ